MKIIDEPLARLLVKAFLITFGSAVGGFAFVAFAVIIAGNPVTDVITSAHGFLINREPATLSEEENAYLLYLIEEGHVVPIQNFIAQIADYYANIIAILLVLIAVVAGLAYLYIRMVSKQEAEDLTRAAVKERFDSAEFDIALNAKVDEAIRTSRKSGELSYSIGEMQAVVDKFGTEREALYERLREEFERYLSDGDEKEDTGGDNELGEPLGDQNGDR